jgi:hypothetical protein
MQPKDLQLLVNLSREDRENLEKLADRWRVKLAEAVRRAVRETLRREK